VALISEVSAALALLLAVVAEDAAAVALLEALVAYPWIVTGSTRTLHLTKILLVPLGGATTKLKIFPEIV
jgi:hypothetical protein